MLAMLDTRQELTKCSTEIGLKVEQLFTPLTKVINRNPQSFFAIDNGAYSHFSRRGFESLLERELDNRKFCRFVCSPDVVGSARRTLEVFNYWKYEEVLKNWPLALVAQDGQEDLPIPWEEIKCIFIGGTTNWKLSQHAVHIIKAAKAMSKWVHVGRVNTPERYLHFKNLGADSFDGSGISKYSHMRLSIGEVVRYKKNPLKAQNIFEE